MMDKKELENKIKKLQEIDPLFEKKQKAVKEVFERVIYLQPQIFKVIAGLGLAVPYDADKDEHMDDYHIFTKYPHTNKKGLKDFAVSLKVGKAIKVLIENSPQYMFPKLVKHLLIENIQF